MLSSRCSAHAATRDRARHIRKHAGFGDISITAHDADISSGDRLGRNASRLVFRKFPFQLIYRVEGDEIAIYAGAHQKLRPDTWRKRLPANP